MGGRVWVGVGCWPQPRVRCLRRWRAGAALAAARGGLPPPLATPPCHRVEQTPLHRSRASTGGGRPAEGRTRRPANAHATIALRARHACPQLTRALTATSASSRKKKMALAFMVAGWWVGWRGGWGVGASARQRWRRASCGGLAPLAPPLGREGGALRDPAPRGRACDVCQALSGAEGAGWRAPAPRQPASEPARLSPQPPPPPARAPAAHPAATLAGQCVSSNTMEACVGAGGRRPPETVLTGWRWS